MASAVRQAAPPGVRVLEILGNAIVGGMETYATRLVEWLSRARFEVSAVCPFESVVTRRLREAGAEVYVAPMAEEMPWSTIQLAATLVRSGGIDVLHAHLPNAHLLAALAGRLTGKPVLTTIHGRQLSPLDIELHRLAGSHVSVVCRDTWFQALAVGVAPQHLSLIENGVDTAWFAPRAEEAEPSRVLRDRWNIASDTPLVGFVGRLSPEKGPDVFLRAALVAHGRQPAAHFVLVGEGPMRAGLEEQAGRAGLSPFLHFAGACSDMRSVYHDLDAVVSTSHSEAMPLVVMEAMACGLPVIATSVGGVVEMIEHERTGWVVRPGDYEGVGARLHTLLSSAPLAREMGRSARERVQERFGLAASCDAMGRLLSRLASGRPEPRRASGGGNGFARPTIVRESAAGSQTALSRLEPAAGTPAPES